MHQARSVFTTLVVIIGLISPANTGLASPLADRPDSPVVATVRGTAARAAQMPGPGPTSTPAQQWHLKPEATGAPLLAPVVADGLLYTIDAKGLYNMLHAVEAITGAERWRYPAAPAEVLVGRPAVTDGLVLVPVMFFDDTTYLTALEARTGEARWRVPLDIDFVSFPSLAVVEGVAYVATGGEDVTALDVADGQVRWRVSVGARAPVETHLAVQGGVVYAVTDEPSIVALDASDGSERWRVRFAEDDILLTPVVADELVFVIAFLHPTAFPEGRLHALAVGSGEERWRSDDDYGLYFEPAVAAGVVYVTAEIPRTRERMLVALDAETGREHWRLAEGQFLISPPSVAGETVYVGSADGLLAVEAATGKLQWDVSVMPVTSVPVVVDGAVYVAGPDGLVALADAT